MRKLLVSAGVVAVIAVTAGYFLLSGEEMTENQLYDAAQRNYAEKKFSESLKMYKKLVKKYPESTRRANAIFMAGYINANNLNDYEEARKYYSMIISEYPEHEFVDDAQFELENMGKEPGELDKILQEKISKAKNPEGKEPVIKK